jgi:aspartyl-tRNA(Asn)/glutamyl-tRNA(Gln) amidotransferase subunit A
VTRRGAFPLSYTFDSIGPIARSVAACELADAVMAGEDTAPQTPIAMGDVRVGLVQGYLLEGMDDTVGVAFPKALNRLQSKWKSADELTLAPLDIMHEVNHRGGIAPPEAYAVHRDLLKEAGEGVDPNVRLRLLRSENVNAADYIQNLRDRERAVAAMDALFDTFDVLAMPTTPIVAPTLEEIATVDTFNTKNMQMLRNTSIWNFFDVCGISLPINHGNELPVGLMLIARHGNDRNLLRIAKSVERALAV